VAAASLRSEAVCGRARDVTRLDVVVAAATAAVVVVAPAALVVAADDDDAPRRGALLALALSGDAGDALLDTAALSLASAAAPTARMPPRVPTTRNDWLARACAFNVPQAACTRSSNHSSHYIIYANEQSTHIHTYTYTHIHTVQTQ